MPSRQRNLPPVRPPKRIKNFYLRGMDADLLAKFKAKCAENGETMKDAITWRMRDYIDHQPYAKS